MRYRKLRRIDFYLDKAQFYDLFFRKSKWRAVDNFRRETVACPTFDLRLPDRTAGRLNRSRLQIVNRLAERGARIWSPRADHLMSPVYSERALIPFRTVRTHPLTVRRTLPNEGPTIQATIDRWLEPARALERLENEFRRVL